LATGSHSCVMRAIASTRTNHPHGPQEHHFGLRHERVFPLLPLASDSANGGFRKSVPSLPKSPQPCLVLSLRVPGVYLSWAYQVFLTFFAFSRINNLRVFSVAFSSIPTAPTSFLIYFTGLGQTARQQKAALRSRQTRNFFTSRMASRLAESSFQVPVFLALPFRIRLLSGDQRMLAFTIRSLA